MTSRRRFLSLLVLSVGPAAALAQPRRRRIARVGLLTGGAVPGDSEPVLRFREDLRKLGWIEGDNLVLEFRYAGADAQRLPDIVAELLGSNVDVLVVGSTPGARAAKAATSKVPIVFAMVSDPVKSELVDSLARPGGNVTGTANMLPETSRKLLELLREAVPKLSRVAVVFSPDNPGKLQEVAVLQDAATHMGIALQRAPVRAPAELDAVFAAIERQKVGGVVVLHDQVTGAQQRRIVDAAARLALPAIYQVDEFVDAGGLMSYGVNVATQYRRAAVYVDKILRGAKPGELPVERPTTFDLVVNPRTANALGIELPQSILARTTRLAR
ncbi:MAG TPA: ABC transporter substrate-binding protein [Casimicrobiaceae bacterium]|nr:ABC transporter substrate-binding protein [Casimicrobiaceae bacterium]